MSLNARILVLLAVSGWASGSFAQTSDPAIGEAALRGAIGKTLPLLQDSEGTWRERRSCASCHHQALGAITLKLARERSFEIDDERFAQHVGWLERGSIDYYLQGEGGINGQAGNSYRLWALATVRRTPNPMTDAVAHFLAGVQHDNGSWRSLSYRPPMEASPFTITALGMRALQHYGPEARSEEMSERIERASSWLEKSQPFTTEEHVFRLLGLAWSGADTQKAGVQLLEMQRQDGGWCQIPTQDSDAYATGQVLVALNQAAGFEFTHPALRKGLRWLAQHQEGDGSWRVRTRRKLEGLPHFETGFPHGIDQFISFAGTCWATLAFLSALEPGSSKLLMGNPAEIQWQQANPDAPAPGEFFQLLVGGSLQELEARLKSGEDPNQRTSLGATPVMVAVYDEERIRLLLEHGAEPRASTENGRSTLFLAAAYSGGQGVVRLLLEEYGPFQPIELSAALAGAALSGSTEAAELLLQQGADIDFAVEPGYTPLAFAGLQGDEVMLRMLLEKGADPEVTAPEFDNETPLMSASLEGRVGTVGILLEFGADIAARDDQGHTALHCATILDPGHTRTIELLLQHGADTGAFDDDGETALTLARRYSNSHLAQILEAAHRREYPAHLGELVRQIEERFEAPTLRVFDLSGNLDDHVVVDVRTPEEIAVSRIPGARVLATEDEREAFLAEPIDRPILVYCAVGWRSAEFTLQLTKAGRDARNLEGGICAWAVYGRPLQDDQKQPTLRIHSFSSKFADCVPEGFEVVLD